MADQQENSLYKLVSSEAERDRHYISVKLQSNFIWKYK